MKHSECKYYPIYLSNTAKQLPIADCNNQHGLALKLCVFVQNTYKKDNMLRKIFNRYPITLYVTPQ